MLALTSYISRGPVWIFQSDEYLIEIVGDFVLSGLAADDGCVLIMTHAHLQAFLAYMHQAGVDVGEKVEQGTLVLFDADCLLQQISVWSVF
jgi:KaiC/GvpD/RAD55 family RecA-like ATPase